MSEEIITEIIVDIRRGKGIVGYGFGDGSGKIDKRNGRPKKFKDPLDAVDWAEAVAEMHKQAEAKYFPDRMRQTKIHITPAYWAWVETEKARLDAAKAARA